VNPPSDPPAGLIRVDLGKGCILLLTQGEYLSGLRRGKFYRRAQALAGRLEGNASEPLPRYGPNQDR